MNESMPVGALVDQGMQLLASTSAPLFASLLILGVIVGLIQAVTQINDPAIGFVPRILAAGLVAFFLGAWMLERFAGFLSMSMQSMSYVAP